MTELDVNLFSDQRRSNWIRLRTLILLRWVAIAGQLTAILIAKEAYNLQLELGLCLSCDRGVGHWKPGGHGQLS